MQTTEPTGRAPTECSRCRRDRPAFERVDAYWEYDDAVADAIRRLKYAGDLPALRAMCRQARTWFAELQKRWPDGAELIPVPAHRTELRQRGFHVPTLALRWLNADAGPATVVARLTKTEQTPRQAGLPYARRRNNVRGVFEATDEAEQSDTAVIFDDVMTTGATLGAAARVLSQSGYDRVVGVVLARAPSPRSTGSRAGDSPLSAPDGAKSLQ